MKMLATLNRFSAEIKMLLKLNFMKLKTKFLIGLSAILLTLGMNFAHTMNGYGFLNGSLCASILAQTTTTGGNTSTGGGGGGSSTGGSSSSGGSGSTSGTSGSSSTNNGNVTVYHKVEIVKMNYEKVVNGVLYKCTYDSVSCTLIIITDQSASCEHVSVAQEVCNKA